MVCGIYCITNSVNGKKYIGQSIDIYRRLNVHKNKLKKNTHDNIHLQRAYIKYGSDAFKFKIIKCCKPKYLDRFEKLYIHIFDSFHNGYNQNTGGNSPTKLSEDTLKKMSESKLGEKNHLWGTHHSFETRIKMSEVKNTSGYFRVDKPKKPKSKQGFTWRYSYLDNNKKFKSIESVSIEKLEQKVKAKGLVWKEIRKEDKNGF